MTVFSATLVRGSGLTLAKTKYNMCKLYFEKYNYAIFTAIASLRSAPLTLRQKFYDHTINSISFLLSYIFV